MENEKDHFTLVLALLRNSPLHDSYTADWGYHPHLALHFRH